MGAGGCGYGFGCGGIGGRFGEVGGGGNEIYDLMILWNIKIQKKTIASRVVCIVESFRFWVSCGFRYMNWSEHLVIV